MKNIKKQMTILALALFVLLSLSACGKKGEEVATAIVRGNIDVIYKGIYDPEYLKLLDSTEAEAEQDYLKGLEVEAEYFAGYWGIADASYGKSFSDLDEELRNDIIELYREIYSHSKYEVQPALKQDDGSYTVNVIVEPIDIMEQASNLFDNEEYEPLNAFWDKYIDTDLSAMSDEEYRDFVHEYGEIIIQMVRDLLPKLGYKEQYTQELRIQTINGVLSINSNDWGTFDRHVIYYP